MTRALTFAQAPAGERGAVGVTIRRAIQTVAAMTIRAR